MSSSRVTDHGSFGDCTLAQCPITDSIFEYRPSLAASSVFIALFVLSGAVHIFQGIRWRMWAFMALMICGLIVEVIGYAGRIIMWSDPWSFNGFIIQIVCITLAPVFFTAAIYVTLYRSIMHLSPTSGRFKPCRYYQIFIPCDILSLILQAIGGGESASNHGGSTWGVDIGLAGLGFQVVTLMLFIALSTDYAIRYRIDLKTGKVQPGGIDGSFKTFLWFLSASTIFIFVRCVYRIYELSSGYSGSALHNQGLFIALESCMIVLAVVALNLGHPGNVFRDAPNRGTDASSLESQSVVPEKLCEEI